MGYRLTRIYTRTGDDGTTALGDGRRADKDCPRIEAIGAVDELNSQIGAILAQPMDDDTRACLSAVQHDLFTLGGELALPRRPAMKADDVARLEQWLDRFNAELPPLEEFILPGGGAAAAACHVARAVCRRAERRAATLHRQEPLGAPLLAYLNRLSDLLFVVARRLARQEGGTEVTWQPR